MSSASLQRRADYQVRGPFRRERRPESRITLLGQPMDLVKPEEMLDFVRRAVRAGRKAVVANHNLHSLSLIRATRRWRRSTRGPTSWRWTACR